MKVSVELEEGIKYVILFHVCLLIWDHQILFFHSDWNRTTGLHTMA